MFKLESEAKYIMELSVQKVKEALETYSTSMGDRCMVHLTLSGREQENECCALRDWVLKTDPAHTKVSPKAEKQGR